MILCECGCDGEIVIKPHHKYAGIPKYIKGHNQKGKSAPMKGRHHTEKTKLKMRKPKPEKVKLKISKSTMGKNNHNYGKFGIESSRYKNPEDRITPLHRAVRTSSKYKDWEHSVKMIFNFTCQYCQVRGGKLVSHHIKRFADIMKENNIKTLEETLTCNELWDVSNGITYCKKCHDLLKKKGGLL